MERQGPQEVFNPVVTCSPYAKTKTAQIPQARLSHMNTRGQEAVRQCVASVWEQTQSAGREG